MDKVRLQIDPDRCEEKQVLRLAGEIRIMRDTRYNFLSFFVTYPQAHYLSVRSALL